MRQSWFCADLHFGHPNILKYSRDTRPFASDNLVAHLGQNTEWKDLPIDIRMELRSTMDTHNSYIVDRINSFVNKNDTLWILGDVSFRSDEDLKYVGNIVCENKNLVLGNHDKAPMADYMAAGFNKIYGVVRHKEFILSHIPVHPIQLTERYQGNIHGHLHTEDVPDKRYINVNIDRTNITPLSLGQIRCRLLE